MATEPVALLGSLLSVFLAISEVRHFNTAFRHARIVVRSGSQRFMLFKVQKGV